MSTLDLLAKIRAVSHSFSTAYFLDLPPHASTIDRYYTQVMKPENLRRFNELCADWKLVGTMMLEEEGENGGKLDPERKQFWDSERLACNNKLKEFEKITDDDEWESLTRWLSVNHYDDGSWYFVDISEEHETVHEYASPEDGGDMAQLSRIAAEEFVKKLPDDVDPDEIAMIDGFLCPRHANYILMRGNSAFRARMTFDRSVLAIPDEKS